MNKDEVKMQNEGRGISDILMDAPDSFWESESGNKVLDRICEIIERKSAKSSENQNMVGYVGIYNADKKEYIGRA